MKNKSTHNMRSVADYTRSKDAYDGNMELTNLKSTSQKITNSSELSTESTSAQNDGAVALTNNNS